MNNHVVLIVAGGTGKRMGSVEPKQFLEINGLPILAHTINAFKNYDDNIPIVIVLPEIYINYWKDICVKYNFNKHHIVVKGGEERFNSVKNGLNYIKENLFYENMIVAIHDGVRPFVDSNLINLAYSNAETHGSAIPVIPIKESLRHIIDGNNKQVDRSKYFKVQTPQCFNFEKIYNSYLNSDINLFTDDASVFENNGYKINCIQGNEENIKITSPFDLKFASYILENN
ncbi:MAG: 2-C-methyl-D-erythritol 4-phosphate cytidylyltransferase [Bacteroidetes bacterium GWE2_29_8]|nr:MAG: 2-C-methyl-D-erythritol 4-phosphate cytidylyltransferase [Bacteroidetes bacterium GWE2_29_8]OFY19946.1 MAG: 2-C-methyl-D-erythritol 4-phosphate cytidylyltransferase [Bacteroidetes bacterium GWF2_29_10]